MDKEEIKKLKQLLEQLLRFILMPLWFPLVFIIAVIIEAWNFCEGCSQCGWKCNCPKGFGANK